MYDTFDASKMRESRQHILVLPGQTFVQNAPVKVSGIAFGYTYSIKIMEIWDTFDKADVLAASHPRQDNTFDITITFRHPGHFYVWLEDEAGETGMAQITVIPQKDYEAFQQQGNSSFWVVGIASVVVGAILAAHFGLKHYRNRGKE